MSTRDELNALLANEIAGAKRGPIRNPFRFQVEASGGLVSGKVEPGRRLSITNLVQAGAPTPPFSVTNAFLRFEIRATLTIRGVSWTSIDIVDAREGCHREVVPTDVARALLDALSPIVESQRRLMILADIVALRRSERGARVNIARVEAEISRRQTKLRHLRRAFSRDTTAAIDTEAALRRELEDCKVIEDYKEYAITP